MARTNYFFEATQHDPTVSDCGDPSVVEPSIGRRVEQQADGTYITITVDGHEDIIRTYDSRFNLLTYHETRSMYRAQYDRDHNGDLVRYFDSDGQYYQVTRDDDRKVLTYTERNNIEYAAIAFDGEYYLFVSRHPSLSIRSRKTEFNDVQTAIKYWGKRQPAFAVALKKYFK